MENLNLRVIRISDIDVKKNMNSVYDFVLKIIKERKEELELIHLALKGTPQEGN